MKALSSPFLLLGMTLAGALQAHAVIYDVYVTTSERGAGTPVGGALVAYQFDTELGEFVGTSGSYNYPIGNGPISREYGAASLTGNGKYIVFTTYDPSYNYINRFDLTSKELINVAQTPRGSGRSTYRSVWSPDGENFWAVGNNNGASPAYFGLGLTEDPTLIRNATAQMNSITYFNNRLYITRGGFSNSGIWEFNSPGLPTTRPPSSPANTTLLSGSGWGSTDTYGAMAFYNLSLDSETTVALAFITNATYNTIDLFGNIYVDGNLSTSTWNLMSSVSTVVEGYGLAPLQLSLVDEGDSVRLFFTTNTNDNDDLGLSTVGTVTWNLTNGFGDVKILANSDSVAFSGVVAITAIPEPGTVMLVVLGMSVVLFFMRRKRVVVS